MSTTIRVRCRPSFDLGQIVATPGALVATTDERRLRHLVQHSIGDWGHALRNGVYEASPISINLMRAVAEYICYSVTAFIS
jgi:hypothetical protein